MPPEAAAWLRQPARSSAQVSASLPITRSTSSVASLTRPLVSTSPRRCDRYSRGDIDDTVTPAQPHSRAAAHSAASPRRTGHGVGRGAGVRVW